MSHGEFKKSGMNIVDFSRYLIHLPWRQGPPPVAVQVQKRLMLVKGTTGTMAPKDQFVALGFYDDEWHPNAADHWYDLNNDHFSDQGWKVTHWCDLED